MHLPSTAPTAINDPFDPVSRSAVALSASPERHTPPRLIGQLSRHNLALSRANLCNDALMRFLLLCYETDDTGLCNVDAPTGRVLIPTPWGRLGHQRYGLRRLEADVLRAIVINWTTVHAPPPLWTYDIRTWALNLFDYAQFEDARRWLAQHQVSAKQFAAVHNVIIRRKQ